MTIEIRDDGQRSWKSERIDPAGLEILDLGRIGLSGEPKEAR